MIYYPSWDLTPKENSRFAPCWHWLHFSEDCCLLRKDRCGWRRQGMEAGKNMLDQHVTHDRCLSHILVSVLLELWGKKFQTRNFIWSLGLTMSQTSAWAVLVSEHVVECEVIRKVCLRASFPVKKQMSGHTSEMYGSSLPGERFN